MAYYKQWNPIVNKVFELIRNNDKLLRYISNAAPNPYDEVASNWSDIFLKTFFILKSVVILNVGHWKMAKFVHIPCAA